MLFSAIFLLAASLATSVYAQSPSGGSPYTISPGDIAALNTTEKASWCQANMNTCLGVCGAQGAYPNNCDDTTLVWTCTCNNGTSPDIGNYEQSVPAFLCQQYVQQCIAATQSAAAQMKCLATPCGKEIVPAPVHTTSSSSKKPTQTKTSATMSASFATGSAAAATSTAAAVVLDVGSGHSSGIMALGMLAVFGLAM